MNLLTVKEVAVLLGVGPNSVYSLINRGELRVVNVSGEGKRPRFRIRTDDLTSFIDANTHDPLGATTQALDAAHN